MKFCSVYWGSHGCDLPRGHEGDCWCDCCECEDHARDHKERGCVAGPPYYGYTTVFYGDDAEARGLNTKPVQRRPCGKCDAGFPPLGEEGPDPCLGTISGVFAACCGHGEVESAYVAFRSGGGAVYGQEALDFFASQGLPYWQHARRVA